MRPSGGCRPSSRRWARRISRRCSWTWSEGRGAARHHGAEPRCPRSILYTAVNRGFSIAALSSHPLAASTWSGLGIAPPCEESICPGRYLSMNSLRRGTISGGRPWSTAEGSRIEEVEGLHGELMAGDCTRLVATNELSERHGPPPHATDKGIGDVPSFVVQVPGIVPGMVGDECFDRDPATPTDNSPKSLDLVQLVREDGNDRFIALQDVGADDDRHPIRPVVDQVGPSNLVPGGFLTMGPRAVMVGPNSPCSSTKKSISSAMTTPFRRAISMASSIVLT